MHTRWHTALLCAALVASTGCTADSPPEPSPATATSTATAVAGCDAIERLPVQAGGHLLPGATPPVPYSSRPPTSGWHASGLVSPGVQPEPLTEPQQVTALEGGSIVVSWRDLPDSDLEALRGFAGVHANGVVATPYEELAPGEVAFTAWGVLQRCRGFDAAAAEAFMEAFAGHGPGH